MVRNARIKSTETLVTIKGNFQCNINLTYGETEQLMTLEEPALVGQLLILTHTKCIEQLVDKYIQVRCTSEKVEAFTHILTRPDDKLVTWVITEWRKSND